MRISSWIDGIIHPSTSIPRLSWTLQTGWDMLEFDFNYSIKDFNGTWFDISQKLVASKKVSNCIMYLFKDYNSKEHGDVNYIDELIVFANISTSNAGHSLSEILSLTHFLHSSAILEPVSIAVSQVVVDHMPFMFELMKRLNPKNKVRVIEVNSVYLIENGIFRINTHYNFTKNWERTVYEQTTPKQLNFFGLNGYIKYLDDTSPIENLVNEIANNSEQISSGTKKAVLIKQARDIFSNTPERSLNLSVNARKHLEDRGYEIFSIDDFTSLDDYITKIYNLKTLITSYGSVACTNRFFVNKECKVTLLANLSYKSEYDTMDFADYRHVRMYHLFPVEEQKVLLDFPNSVTTECARIIAGQPLGWR